MPDSFAALRAAGYLRRGWPAERVWLHFAGTLSLAGIEAIAARLAESGTAPAPVPASAG